MRGIMRKTKIICTIGPASDSEEKLQELMLAGMNVARFNFSHDNHELHKIKFAKVSKISQSLQLPIATLMDTKGPEIRLKDFEAGKVELKKGQTFTLCIDDIAGTQERVSITYANLVNDVKEGSALLIDDGLVELCVQKVTHKEIICTVMNDGVISNKKGVNVPGAHLSMPFISEKDRSDILFGIEVGFDYIAASFVRTAEDVKQIREIIDAHKSPMKIIAKIESMQGIENIDSIIDAADGIMVARGDMGVEIPFEEVPILQKKIINKTVAKGKHVITATQMLDSMMKNPRPTRAEATDVANAIYDGTTAIMLSGESANGQYPIEAVKTMSRIAERAEADIDYRNRFERHCLEDVPTITTSISRASCTTAMELNAAAILTVTISGFTANMISRYKPSCPIIACSVNPRVCRQLNLSFGVSPLLTRKQETMDDLFDEAIHTAKRAGLIKSGDTVVLTAGVPLSISPNTNMIQVVTVE